MDFFSPNLGDMTISGRDILDVLNTTRVGTNSAMNTENSKNQGMDVPGLLRTAFLGRFLMEMSGHQLSIRRMMNMLTDLHPGQQYGTK